MAPHAIVHVAIPAPNPAVLGPFYAELFGWKLHDPTFNNYHPFHADSGPNGAFVQVNDTTGPKVGEVVIHVSTDDIDATLARVEALGGKTLHPKTEIPHTGWFALFADPAGNRIALVTLMSQPS